MQTKKRQTRPPISAGSRPPLPKFSGYVEVEAHYIFHPSTIWVRPLCTELGPKNPQKADFAMKQTNICRLSGDIMNRNNTNWNMIANPRVDWCKLMTVTMILEHNSWTVSINIGIWPSATLTNKMFRRAQGNKTEESTMNGMSQYADEFSCTEMKVFCTRHTYSGHRSTRYTIVIICTYRVSQKVAPLPLRLSTIFSLGLSLFA